jgi:hypothetical protein
MHDFRKLATMTPAELARLSPTAPTVAPHGIGVGVDADQYETPIGDAARLASQIVAAAKTARAGGPMAAKMSDAAQQIIDAGKRRRAEG